MKKLLLKILLEISIRIFLSIGLIASFIVSIPLVLIKPQLYAVYTMNYFQGVIKLLSND